MAKYLFLTGFNGSQPELEDNMIEYLKNKGKEIEKIDYYGFYKSANSRELIEGITNAIIRKYYENGCEPLNLIGWSLGGAILTEVLNNISIINEQLTITEDLPIKIGQVVLFSPAWHIIDTKNYIKSHVNPNFYATKEAKELNSTTEGKAPAYLIKHPLALWHLFRISYFSKQMTNYINDPDRNSDGGIPVLGNYDTTLILPRNDAYVNVKKTMAEAEQAGIKTVMIDNYGHLAPVIKEAVEDVLNKFEESKGPSRNRQ